MQLLGSPSFVQELADAQCWTISILMRHHGDWQGEIASSRFIHSFVVVHSIHSFGLTRLSLDCGAGRHGDADARPVIDD